LSAFGKDALALAEQVVEEVFGVGELKGAQEIYCGEELSFELFDFELLIIVSRQHGVVGYGFLITSFKIGLQDVADAETNATNFVGVRGADAFEGAAYFGAATGFLVDAVEGAVAGEDELGLFGDVKVFGPIHSSIGKLLELGAENHRVENNAVAYYIKDVGVKNAAWHLVEDMLDAVEGEGVTGIGAALEAGYGIVGGR
jgi:hypothetical protein